MPSDSDKHTAPFPASWDALENYYQDIIDETPAYGWLTAILTLVHNLRQLGYDTHLRAGQSLLSAVFSRSLHHTLRTEQHFIALEPHRDGRMEIEYVTPEQRHTVELTQTIISSELIVRLDQLVQQPIN